MFQTVKTDVFTRSAFLTRSLQERLFCDDFELDFGGVLGPGLLIFCFLVALMTNACMFCGSQLTSLILSVKSDVEESKNSSRCR